MPEPAKRKNLASLVDTFEQNGSDIALTSTRGFRQKKITYAELASLSRRFAAELSKREIHKGDRVLLWGENGIEWVAAFFGCVLQGVLPVPLDSAGSQSFAHHVGEEVSPTLVVADREKLHNFRCSHPCIVLEDLATTLPHDRGGRVESLAPDDPLQLVFTSGTTGEPKGIVHTHLNVLASLAPIEREMHNYLKYERLFHPIRILHTLPLSHVFGQFMGLWIPPALAAEVHFQSRFVASELVGQIRRERISILAAVPRLLDLLQSHLLARSPELKARMTDAQHLPVWRRYSRFLDIHRLFGLKFWAFVCGGASLSPESEHFWNTLGFAVIQGYGMTETTALISLNHPFHPTRGSIGQVLPGREVKLSDEGEVLVRGDTISRSTWQGGRLEQRDSEWLPTGDLAEFDASGNLRFRGRKKDLIVTSAGLNIHPEDLEAALLHQPGVKAAIIVERNTANGPEPHAVLIHNPGVQADQAVAAANRELAAFQQIRHWSIWPEADFPRTSTGKVLRREIAARISSAAIPSDDGEASLSDLDSLGRVQLQAQLEQRYGVALDDMALQNAQTGADLQHLIQQVSAEGIPETSKRLTHRYPLWPWNPVQQSVRNIFLDLVAVPLVRFLASPAIARRTQQWPGTPLLIVANHITSYDAAFVLAALPRPVRHKLAIAMSGEMLLDFRRGRNQGNWFLNLLGPIAYFLMTALFNVFPLPQLGGFRESFRHMGEAIDRGYSVLVFPEGRRSESGAPQPFKTGAGLIWKELNIPALPVFLTGLGEIKARGTRWFRSGKIEVRLGESLSLKHDRSPEQLTEILRGAVFDTARVSK